MTNSDDDPGTGEEPVPSERTERQESTGTTSAEGRHGSSRRSRAADPADDDDYDYYDDYGDYGHGSRREPSGRRDLLIVIGIAALVIVALLVVLLRKDNKDTKSGNAAGSGSSQTGDTSTTAGKALCGDWVGPVGGEPTALKSTPGVYVWSGFDGWHVRARGAEFGLVAVKISGQAPIKVNKLVPGAPVASKPTPLGADVTIPSGPSPRGADLTIDCSSTSLQFEITSNGKPLPASKIVLGVSAHPAGPIFTLQRATT